jgi:hypothetical protein
MEADTKKSLDIPPVSHQSPYLSFSATSSTFYFHYSPVKICPFSRPGHFQPRSFSTPVFFSPSTPVIFNPGHFFLLSPGHFFQPRSFSNPGRSQITGNPLHVSGCVLDIPSEGLPNTP